MKLNEILLKPIITEKVLQQVKNSTYAFYVNMNANKQQIKKAVEELFSVEVNWVKTHIKKGKIRKIGKRMKAKKLPDCKIAYLKVKKGKISIFPQT